MKEDLEIILEKCIEELQQGKRIEDCLKRYLQFSSELKPLLEMVQIIEKTPKPESNPEALYYTLVKVGEIAGEKLVKQKERTKKINWLLFPHPLLLRAVIGFFVLILISWGAIAISANTTPGEILYPIKIATEKVKFFLTFDSEKKAELRLTFSDERLREMTHLLQRSGTLDIELLKAMLDEAKMALEESKIPSEKAPIFFAKLDHFNAYQKEVLEKIRPQVDPVSREIVDEARRMCDMRSRWIRRMMDEEMEQMPKHSPSIQRQEKHRSKKWRWGPGCDWMNENAL
ncbi:MAG: DUF5667 domain-containing protein [Acidobacteriota bacterium]